MRLQEMNWKVTLQWVLDHKAIFGKTTDKAVKQGLHSEKNEEAYTSVSFIHCKARELDTENWSNNYHGTGIDVP